MKKVMIKISLFTVLAVFLIASKANALDYETAYMVRDNNSHVLSLDVNNNYSYNFGEKPWLYLKLKLEDLALNSPLHMHWVWSSFDNPNVTETANDKISIVSLGSDKEIWTVAPEPWWTNSGGPGNWHVDVNWFNVKGTNGISSADFISCPQGGIPNLQAGQCGPLVTVTPEPLSTTLFLLGGAPLLATIRKRQKTV